MSKETFVRRYPVAVLDEDGKVVGLTAAVATGPNPLMGERQSIDFDPKDYSHQTQGIENE